MRIQAALLFLALSGCATTQVPFQKSATGIGYSVEEKGADNFIVKANLPADFDAKSTERYVARAVGEECLLRKFEFFDYTDPANGVSEGFCFKENKRKAFAIKFKDSHRTTPPVFVVDHLNQKTQTSLQSGDTILRVEDKNVVSVAELKSLAFAYGNKKIANVKIELLRDGKNMTVSEPLADLSGAAHGSESLDALRIRYQ